jgi:hypothetical protein
MVGYRVDMGLTIHWDLRAPVTDDQSVVVARLSALRARAVELPFDAVSELVQLSEVDLNAPWPMRGLAFPRLEDVVDVAARSVRADIYCQDAGITGEERWRVDVPVAFPVIAMGFAVAVGPGSEPAAFGLATMRPPGSIGWSWHSYCKTQYASNHGEENFLRCHTSVIALLDAARGLGCDVDVHDEGGYCESRDKDVLLGHVTTMNRLVARIAGSLVDQTREAGGDSRQIEGGIFEHPDFERLESED